MINSHPEDPIPVGHSGSHELPPRDWAKKLRGGPWKVARKSRALKGELLPQCCLKKLVRDLIARARFFWSKRRQQEQVSDRKEWPETQSTALTMPRLPSMEALPISILPFVISVAGWVLEHQPEGYDKDLWEEIGALSAQLQSLVDYHFEKDTPSGEPS